MSVIIDPGHQGKGYDPGAVGNGIIEADMVLDISLYQYERFKELGVPVKITRTKTMSLPNATRTKIIKDSGMKHCLCNHINAGGGDGAEVIYSVNAKPTFAQNMLNALVSAGQNARKIFTRSLPSNPKSDYYFMHRDTGAVETVIIEYGFLDSKKDDVSQLKSDWKKYAEAIVKAYCEHAGYKYTAPKATVAKPVETKPATPAKTDDYADMAKWAKDNGIWDGTNPSNPATREQVAVMLGRLYKKLTK